MGLDTTHNCWHGGYTAFNTWRHQVARVAGYEVETRRQPSTFGTGIEFEFETPVLDWDTYTEANLLGEWQDTPSDPLLVLLVHSDADGWIYPVQAGPLADRLEELLPQIPEHEDVRADTVQFIKGLRQAAEAGEPVGFH